MYETYIKKNHDYGNSFDISMNEDGEPRLGFQKVCKHD